MITGLGSGESIRDLAVRPADNVIYALTGPGGFGASGPERVYRLTDTGAATLVSTLSQDLADNQLAISFNPCVDRLRVVGVTDATNFRVNVDTGATTTDGPLAYAAGDPNASATPRITGAGYTAATPGTGCATTLYDYDLRDANSNDPQRILTIQNPPNDGTLNTVADIAAPTTAFGQDLAIGNFGGAEVGYLTGSTGNLNQSNVFRVNLSDGSATDLGGAGESMANSGIGAITIRRANQGPDPVIPEFPAPALALAAVAGAGAIGMVVVRRRAGATTA